MPTEDHSLIAGNFYVDLRMLVEPRQPGRGAFAVRRKPPGIIVWLVSPARKIIELDAAETIPVPGIDEPLTRCDVLPDLEISVRKLFESHGADDQS